MSPMADFSGADGSDITPEAAIRFLDKMSRYFASRETGGEDIAHWANVTNAANCRRIINLIIDLASKLPPEK